VTRKKGVGRVRGPSLLSTRARGARRGGGRDSGVTEQRHDTDTAVAGKVRAKVLPSGPDVAADPAAIGGRESGVSGETPVLKAQRMRVPSESRSAAAANPAGGRESGGSESSQASPATKAGERVTPKEEYASLHARPSSAAADPAAGAFLVKKPREKTYFAAYHRAMERIRELEARVADMMSHPLRSPRDEANYWYGRFKEVEARVKEMTAGTHVAHLQDDELILGCPECDAEAEANEREKAELRGEDRG